MQYKLLGVTGVEVSRLCFGTMSFGGDADWETSAAMYRRCRDAGVNLFDCADVYPNPNSPGISEEILGKLTQGERDELVLVSKVYSKVGPGRNDRGLSRRHIMRAVEKSLKRLKTDRLDLYFLHNYDPNANLGETFRALDDLVRDGKVLYIGVSNWAAWQTATGLALTEQRNWAPVTCVQPMYNLVKRQVEVEILPLARYRNLGVITYSPVGGGFLSGKYTSSSKPATGRLVDSNIYAKRYGSDFHFDIAERFSKHSEDRGLHPVTVAVAWVMANDAVTAPIIGARNVKQLEHSLAAADVQMDRAWYEEISELSPAPPPAHDRGETSA